MPHSLLSKDYDAFLGPAGTFGDSGGFVHTLFLSVGAAFIQDLLLSLTVCNRGDTMHYWTQTNSGALLHSSMLMMDNTTQYHGGHPIKGVMPSPMLLVFLTPRQALSSVFNLKSDRLVSSLMWLHRSVCSSSVVLAGTTGTRARPPQTITDNLAIILSYSCQADQTIRRVSQTIFT